MLIQCTKALLDKIGIKGSELASPEGNVENAITLNKLSVTR